MTQSVPTTEQVPTSVPEEGLIVVVDDTEANRYAVAHWLTRAGFRVAEAATGEEALALAGGRADLVLLDVQLPDVSGFEVARRLKTDPKTAHLPVLHLSAVRVRPEDRAQGLDVGADGYLTHPVEPEELVASVRALLRLSRTERELRERNASLERALAQAHRAAARVARLQAATAALASATTAEEVAAIVLGQGRAALDAAAGAVFTLSQDGTALELLREDGFGADAVAPWRTTPLSSSLPITDPARTGHPIWSTTLAERVARYPHLATAGVTGSFGAWAALPLWVHHRAVGSLSFAFAAPHAYDEADRLLMCTFADQCAQALERARLFAAERAARADAEAARAQAEQARAEAEAANRAKGEFLATMSHELRTPLNAIGGYAELLEMGLRGPLTEEQRRDLQRLQASQRHLLGLINEVLNYARLETGTVHYVIDDVRLCDALVSAEALVMPQARAKALELTVSLCAPELAARADAEKLRQVLVNLLSNAIKFTDRGGRVELDCVEAADHALVRVRDTGIGIATDHLERIFEPFVQVRADLTRTAEGTGLGLAISRDLARGMGGDLTAESTVGVGSTFTLRLPRAV